MATERTVRLEYHSPRRIRWHDHSKRTRKLKQPTGQPVYRHKHDSTVRSKQFYLQPNSRPLHVTPFFVVLWSSCFPNFNMHFFFSPLRVTWPVHWNLLHVTSLTIQDGLHESWKSSLRRLIGSIHFPEVYYFPSYPTLGLSHISHSHELATYF